VTAARDPNRHNGRRWAEECATEACDEAGRDRSCGSDGSQSVDSDDVAERAGEGSSGGAVGCGSRCLFLRARGKRLTGWGTREERELQQLEGV
jgi:hypothetical protein